MKLLVKQGLAGRGVFAAEKIPDRSVIMQYTGPLLTYAQTSPTTLAVQIGPDRYLGSSGNPDDYVNHSCIPNAGLVITPHDVTLIAIRDIEIDEEITFDYSTTMDEDDFEMPCHCHTSACRHLIRDFKHLPKNLQHQYASFGIIPNYNLKYLFTNSNQKFP